MDKATLGGTTSATGSKVKGDCVCSAERVLSSILNDGSCICPAGFKENSDSGSCDPCSFDEYQHEPDRKADCKCQCVNC